MKDVFKEGFEFYRDCFVDARELAVLLFPFNLNKVTALPIVL